MKSVRPLLIVAVVGLVLVPSSGSAGGRGHHGGVVVVAPRGSVVVVRPSPVFVHPVPRVFIQPRSVFPVVVDPWRFWGVSVFPRPFFASPFFARPFFPVVASVPVTSVYTSVLYAPTPAYSPPPAVTVPAPAPMPVPTLIEYPTGWYQLRGDGVTSPYVWVWIPKPPPPPPSEAPPDVPPAPASKAPAAPLTQPPLPTSPGELYRWTDEESVAHWTDRLDNIPERYRSKAQRQT